MLKFFLFQRLTNSQEIRQLLKTIVPRVVDSRHSAPRRQLFALISFYKNARYVTFKKKK